MCFCAFLLCLVIRQFHCNDDEPSVSFETSAAFYVSHETHVLMPRQDFSCAFENFLYDNQLSKAAAATDIVSLIFPNIRTSYQTLFCGHGR